MKSFFKKMLWWDQDKIFNFPLLRLISKKRLLSSISLLSVLMSHQETESRKLQLRNISCIVASLGMGGWDWRPLLEMLLVCPAPTSAPCWASFRSPRSELCWALQGEAMGRQPQFTTQTFTLPSGCGTGRAVIDPVKLQPCFKSFP